MKIKTRKWLLAVLIALFAIVCFAIPILKPKTKAMAAQNTDIVFAMKDGASVRLTSDGLRFQVCMNKETRDNIVENDNVSLHFLIAPASYFAGVICNKDGVIELTNRKEWCLGDWESPKGRDGLLPAPFVNTCLYINTLQTLVDIAKEFGFNKDAERFELRIFQLKNNIDKLYFDNKTGDYCGNEQGSNAFAIKAGIGDERTLKNLVARYQELNEFDTGIFATKILIETLLGKGYPEVAYDLLTSKKEVTYYSWMAEGATTLYESWKNARSYNHPMFGSVVEQFFTHILGIRQAKNSHGYQEVVINPLRFDKLNKANGRIHTEKGAIYVLIEKTQGAINFIVEIPKGIDAHFIYENYQQTLNCGKNIIQLKLAGEYYEEAV